MSKILCVMTIMFVCDVAMSQTKIALVPAHGRTYVEGGEWKFQRDYVFFYAIEDILTPQFVRYLDEALRGDGLETVISRSMNFDGSVGVSERLVWEEASKYYLESKGYSPCVWNEATFPTEINKDINSRFRFAEVEEADLLVIVHTNALQPPDLVKPVEQTKATGTLVFFSDLNNANGQSAILADVISTNIKTAVDNNYLLDWKSKAVKTEGETRYGEVEGAHVPAVIVEVAYHDRRYPDADLLNQDNFHRVIALAIRNGINEYLANNALPPTIRHRRPNQSSDSLSLATINLRSERIVTGETKEFCLLKPADRDFLEFNLVQNEELLLSFIGLPVGTNLYVIDDLGTKVAEYSISSSIYDQMEFGASQTAGKFYLSINDPVQEFGNDLIYSVGVHQKVGCSVSTATKTQQLELNQKLDCSDEVKAPTLLSPHGDVTGVTQRFSWGEVADAKQFELYVYSVTLDSSDLVYQNKTLLGLNHTIPFGILEQGKSYKWKMRAVNSLDDKSAYSTSLYFHVDSGLSEPSSSIDPPTLSYPGSVNAYNIGTAEPIFYWQKVSGASNYGVFIANDDGNIVYQNTGISGGKTTHPIPKGILRDGGQYHWYMISIDVDGYRSHYSSALKFNVRLPEIAEPKLEFVRYNVDDNNYGDSSGDDDGRAEGGETVELDVYIENTGKVDATNLVGSLSTNSTCVHVSHSDIGRNRIDSGDVEKLNDFIIEIEQCVDGTKVPFVLGITSDQESWVEHFHLPVFDNSISRADIKYQSHVVEDDKSGYGNNDGLANAGETFDLNISLKNHGDERAHSVRLTPTPDSSCIDVISDSYAWSFIGINGAREYQFKVYVDGDCAPTVVGIDLEVESVKSSWTDSFHLQVLQNDFRPDLKFAVAPSLSQPVVEELQNTQVEVTLVNAGNLRSSKTIVHYYLSDDSVINLDDIEIGSDSRGELKPDSTGVESKTFAAPEMAGLYYIGACIERAEGEGQIENNCSLGIPLTVEPRVGADLVITDANVSDTNPHTHSLIDYSYTVQNKGMESSGFTEVDRYFSQNPDVLNTTTKYGDSDQPSLGSSESNSFTSDLLTPKFTGKYWLTFCIRPTSNEIVTNNNCAAPIEVNVRDRQFDLQILNAPSLDYSNPNPDQKVEVSARVTNVSGDISDDTTINFFMKSDDVEGFPKIPLGSDVILARKPGAGTNGEIDFYVPTVEGKYWLAACVVAAELETNSANNCSPLRSFYVGEEPAEPEDDDLCFPVITENRKIALICL